MCKPLNSEAPMKIAISACLLGRQCRYDGRSNLTESIINLQAQFKDQVDFVPICPEVLGNLSVPRTPCEKQGDKIIAKDGTDCTSAFENGAKKAFQIIKDSGCTVAILKARSPSCGPNGIYDGTFTHTLVSGSGVFATLLKKDYIKVFTEENIESLIDFLRGKK